jgi:NAD(P)-dependent dehydrogenase (short-subunit alcohol dehydrogenase family)
MDVNLTACSSAAAKSCRDARRRLRPHRQHRVGRRQGRQPNASAYSASKAAVIALTKSLGKELADTGVRVTASPRRQ